MTKNKMKLVRQRIKKAVMKNARKQIKTNEKLQTILKELNRHFKADGWDLDYDYYIHQTGLHAMTFNAVLEIKKYRIAYSSSSLNVVIRK